MKLLVMIALAVSFSGQAAFAQSSSQLKMESYQIPSKTDPNVKETLEQLKISLGGDLGFQMFELLRLANAKSPDRVKKAPGKGKAATYGIENMYAFNVEFDLTSALFWLSLERGEWFNGWMLQTQQGAKLVGGFSHNSHKLLLDGKSANTVLEVMKLAGVVGKAQNKWTVYEHKLNTASIRCTEYGNNIVSCTFNDSYKPN